VLPGHANLLALLRGGVCVVVTDRGEQRFVVGRGFCEAGPERVTLLTDVAEPVESVDRAAAERDIAQLEQAMTGLDLDSAEFKLNEERLEVARARLTA
jgi:F-type H+-transporting ATPase subunit epsilon